MDKRLELFGVVCHATLGSNLTYHVKVTEGQVKLYEFNAKTYDEGPDSAREKLKAFFNRKVDEAFATAGRTD